MSQSLDRTLKRINTQSRPLGICLYDLARNFAKELYSSDFSAAEKIKDINPTDKDSYEDGYLQALKDIARVISEKERRKEINRQLLLVVKKENLVSILKLIRNPIEIESLSPLQLEELSKVPMILTEVCGKGTIQISHQGENILDSILEEKEK